MVLGAAERVHAPRAPGRRGQASSGRATGDRGASDLRGALHPCPRVKKIKPNPQVARCSATRLPHITLLSHRLACVCRLPSHPYIEESEEGEGIAIAALPGPGKT